MLKAMSKSLEDASEVKERQKDGTVMVSTQELNIRNAQEQEKHAVWEIEFKEMKEQHMKVLAEFEAAKLEIGKLEIISAHEQEKYVTREAELKGTREQHVKTLAELHTARQELEELRISTTREQEKCTTYELKWKETEEQHIKAMGELESTKEELELLKVRMTFEQEKAIVFQTLLEKTKEEHMTALAELETANQELEELQINTSQKEKHNIPWEFELKVTKEQHMEALAEIETMRQKIVELEISRMQEEEKCAAREFELKEAKQQHVKILVELETAKQELENLKRELLASLNEKESIVRLAEEALTAAEVNAKRVEELTVDIHGNNNSLILVKKELTIAKELQLKLGAATDELQRLQTELAAAREAEERVANIAAEAVAHLDYVKSELERTRTSEASAISSLTTLSAELQETKANLKAALDDGVSLRTLMDSLQNELQLVKSELGGVREREANAIAAVATLTNELKRTKSELVVAAAAEAKANDGIYDLYQVLQQVIDEAEEAKMQVEALGEEVWKARADAEKAKSDMDTAESKLQAALQEANMAKAAEVATLGKVKGLSEDTIAARSLEVEDGTVSKEEYNALLRKMQDAEDLTSMQVAAALTHVDAVKASKHKMEQELEKANQKIEDMQKTIKQALHRAKIAETAKDIAERELRILREEEHRRSRELLLTAEQAYVWNGNGDDNSNCEHSFSLEIGERRETFGEDVEDIKRIAKQALHRAEIAEAAKSAVEIQLKRLREGNYRREREMMLPADELFSSESPPTDSLRKVMNIEPLGKVLNMKIPSDSGHKLIERLPKKKGNFLPSIGGYLAKK
eukprot:c22746_g1_i2 orf=103-2550(+)